MLTRDRELVERVGERAVGEALLDHRARLGVVRAHGVADADLIQNVRTRAGAECGVILWETKNTKAWRSRFWPKMSKKIIEDTPTSCNFCNIDQNNEKNTNFATLPFHVHREVAGLVYCVVMAR